MRKGKFIVIYGINNMGKTTQVKLLVDRLNENGINSEYLKYAIYYLEPSGQMINEHLRKKNPEDLSAREFQIFQVWNRQQYEPLLAEKLNKGISVVAEDYAGTGIAWGIANGVNPVFLERINSKLLRENLAFLILGKQFSGKEKYHTYESNALLTRKAIRAHLELAERYGWIKIDGNKQPQEISDEIFYYVKKIYSKQELNFYFGISIINSDRSNLKEGKEIVRVLKKHGTVLSEHVVRDDVMEFEAENIRRGINIFERDISWVDSSDYIVIEGSKASTGIGREVQRARNLNIPVLFLYKQCLKGKITRMITGDKGLTHVAYEDTSKLEEIIENYIKQNKFWID